MALKTAKEREAEFKHDLRALLSKHNAELVVTDDGKDYGMHSGVCEITMDTKWNENGNQLEEFTIFYLDKYMP